MVLEIIPNHTGKKHPWFEASRSQGKNGPYADYYVWHPGKENEDGSTIPPSNWVGYGFLGILSGLQYQRHFLGGRFFTSLFGAVI